MFQDGNNRPGAIVPALTSKTLKERLPKKQLSHPEFYKLCQWLSANGERLMAERPSRQEAADAATAKLGFVVSKFAIAATCEATGISWKMDRTESRRKPITALAMAVKGLYEKLGEPVPEEIKELTEPHNPN